MKTLNAPGKGEVKYDHRNDVLLFKIRDRDYSISMDFGNLVADLDKEGFITGLRIFDASKVFEMHKLALNGIKNFEFKTKVENKVVTIQLRFTSTLRNKPTIKQGQDFVREALSSQIKDSEVICSVA